MVLPEAHNPSGRMFMARKKKSEELDQLSDSIEYLKAQLNTSEVQSNTKLRDGIENLLNDNYRQYFQLSTGQARCRSISNTNGSTQG